MKRETASVCVYCGARDGASPDYRAAARDFGAALARRDLRLVYGAGDFGLMGETARGCLAAGGQALGIIPRHLIGVEARPGPRNAVVITETMHERKTVMLANAEAVAVLPGGIGSLDEFFETLTWRALGLHDKPMLLLNVNGFWEPLLTLLDHLAREGFVDAGLRAGLIVETEIETGLDRLMQAAQSRSD